MKKSLILVAALVACTVVLTPMTGLVQAQSLSSPSTEIEIDEGEAEVSTEDDRAPAYVDPYGIFTSVCTVGPRSGDVLFLCYVPGSYGYPRHVSCQPRNHPSQYINWPDQFACQIIGPNNAGGVWVRIRRLDAPGAGWGQNLQINLLVVQ